MEGREEITRVLPRGRNAASREVVQSSQRARLIEAMRELAAREGANNVTIGQLAARAGVAKPTFYEHFQSKEELFIAVFDEDANGLVSAITKSLDPDALTAERIRVGVNALLDYLAKDDDRARVIAIEPPLAGPKAVKRLTEAHNMLAQFYISLREDVRSHHPQVKPLSETRATAIVGAITEPICAALREGKAADLVELEDELVEVVTLLATNRA
ncbi:MAG: TetR/AcrR family transcriptional regulator [Solirubrobacterales bacterium]